MAEKLEIGLADNPLDYVKSSKNTVEQNGAAAENPELLAITERARKLNNEKRILEQLQSEKSKHLIKNKSIGLVDALEENIIADGRSVFVGNVDYNDSIEELERHFLCCGLINRLNISCNKYDGVPKGFACIEFEEIDSAQKALAMDNSLFKGKHLKVFQERTNRPGLSNTSSRRPRRRNYWQAPWVRNYYPAEYEKEVMYRPRGYGYGYHHYHQPY